MSYLKILLAVVVSFVGAVNADDLASLRRDNLIAESYDHYRLFFEDLHRNPELSGKEILTSQKVAVELNALGIEVTTGIGGYGVVGVLRNGSGPTLLMRADLDALPIQEESGLNYASQNAGVMHACGHDFHSSSLLGSANVLIQTKDQWSGTIVFVFQPAEETLKGANAMIADGLFTRFPKPDMAIGLHSAGQEASGTLSYRPESIMAAADSVDVEFTGRDAHGSMPHLSIDPIVMAAEYVLKMNALVAREVNPLQPAVITVGSIHAGTRYNIIPSKSHLQLTIRTFDEDIRAYLKRRVVETANEIARASNSPTPPEVSFPEGASSTYNDPTMSAQVAKVFQNTLGADKVTIRPAIMGAEDFSEYVRKGNIPGHYYFVGVTDSTRPKPWPSNHTSKYAVDFKKAWPTGVKTMTASVISLLPAVTGLSSR